MKPKTWNKDKSIQNILALFLGNSVSGQSCLVLVGTWQHFLDFLLDTTSLAIKFLPLLHSHIHLQQQSQSHEDEVISPRTCTKSDHHSGSPCAFMSKTWVAQPLFTPVPLAAVTGPSICMLSVALEWNEILSGFRVQRGRILAQSQISFRDGKLNF